MIFKKNQKSILAYSFLSVDYRKKAPCLHVELSQGLLYPPVTPPYWQNFWIKAKTRLSPVSLVFLGQLFLYLIKPSSVTKRNIMDGMDKACGIVYTPHQCWYSDRKSPYWEKNLKVSEGTSGTSITIPNTSLLMAITIFNPLNRTWAISRPPRSQRGYFGLK